MKIVFLCGFSALLLIASGPTEAWHWEDEEESEHYTSQAGDPLYLEDMEGCLEQAEGLHGVRCSALYTHLFETSEDDVPVNIQRPSPACVDQAWGTGVPTSPGGFQSPARFELRTTPSFVQYRGGDCDGARVHPERGHDATLKISPDVDLLGYWYLSSDMGGPFGDPISTGVLPCLSVHMRLQHGPGPDAATLAQGSTTKTIVSRSDDQGMDPATPLPQPPCPNGETPDGTVHLEEATEIEVNLGKVDHGVNVENGLVFHVALDLDEGGDPHDEAGVRPLLWKQHAGADHPNRVVLALEDSIRVERVRPQLFDGKIYIHTSLNSVWGAYDVDLENIRLQIEDEAGRIIADRSSPHMGAPIHRYSHSLVSNLRAANVTFPWDHTKENLESGQYTIRVTAANWQHTATATKETTFTMTDNQEDCCISGFGPRPEPKAPEVHTDWVPTLISTLAVLVFLGVLAGTARTNIRF